MSLELAAQIVSKLTGDEKIEAFCHFERFFKLSEKDKSGKATEDFAVMCGFRVASDIQLL